MSYREELKREMFMRVAEIVGELGTCDRKRVGTVIVRDGRCISWGFNGAPPGLSHCGENMHGWLREWEEWVEHYRDRDRDLLRAEDDADARLEGQIKQFGCRNATHAEANALAAAAKQGISTEGGTLLTTCSPCDTCSRLIIAAGIIHVYYREEYRDGTGLWLLGNAGVQADRI